MLSQLMFVGKIEMSIKRGMVDMGTNAEEPPQKTAIIIIIYKSKIDRELLNFMAI